MNVSVRRHIDRRQIFAALERAESERGVFADCYRLKFRREERAFSVSSVFGKNNVRNARGGESIVADSRYFVKVRHRFKVFGSRERANTDRHLARGFGQNDFRQIFAVRKRVIADYRVGICDYEFGNVRSRKRAVSDFYVFCVYDIFPVRGVSCGKDNRRACLVKKQSAVRTVKRAVVVDSERRYRCICERRRFQRVDLGIFFDYYGRKACRPVESVIADDDFARRERQAFDCGSGKRKIGYRRDVFPKINRVQFFAALKSRRADLDKVFAESDTCEILTV